MVVIDEARLVEEGTDGAFIKVLCGRIAPCSGMLGELRRPFGAGRLTMYYRNICIKESHAAESAWFLSHPAGYRRAGEGFRVLKDRPLRAGDDGRLQRRRGLGGARKVPEPLRTGCIEVDGGWGTVGDRPELPTLVYCPQCGRLNRVTAPVDEAADGAI